jgi:hypothetical protein
LVKVNPEYESGRLQLGRAQMEMGGMKSLWKTSKNLSALTPKSGLVKKALCQSHTNLPNAFGGIKNQKQSEHHSHEAIKIIPDLVLPIFQWVYAT